MSDIQAFSTSDIPAAAATPTASGANSSALRATPISVEIVDAMQLAGLRPAWDDLLTRADTPNVLMDPAMVQAATEAFPQTQSTVLLAWKTPADGKRQLAGIWAFSVGRPHLSAAPVRVLNAPVGPHRYLAAPVIDHACLDETLHAMLDEIAARPELPKIIALEAMPIHTPTMDALQRVLTARGSAACILEQFRRPKLVSDLDGKGYLEKALSSSSRKKLRQHRRRLEEKGTLTSVVVTEPNAVRGALEDFMRMEAAGWKGNQGTALLCNAPHAEFMRKAVSAMSQLRCAWMHALYLDGKPVSMQIIMRAGSVAFTWKTTYDEQFQDFSPGMLLLEDYTTSFLADKSIATVDSCAHNDSGYMSAWTDRQLIADIWIDAERGGSMAFRVLSLLQKRYRDARAATKSAHLALQNWRKRQNSKG
jgi:CelD/BcsL family acetyltransferase involved in cellulose biosynthesis